ncbi:LexA family protein (plasmid) [Rahnella aceris]
MTHLIPIPADFSFKNMDTAPLYMEAIHAGFPSPAQGFEKQELNLHDYCVKNKNSSFFLRVSGSSMEEANINDGDLVVVDRSLTPTHGSIVVASLDNEFTLKRLLLKPKPCLMPMNPAYTPIYFDPDSDAIEIWGVVTYSVMRHSVCSQ